MTALIGRDAEMDILKQHLADAISGKGSTVLISGEPGIGKTRLVEEFRKHVEQAGVRILSGAAMSGSTHPFQVFSKALEGVTDKPLFEESEYISFTEIFAVNGAGLLLAKASSEEGGLDADIFAGMLSAVQDFVRDSFGGGGKAGLGRLEYGDMKILIEHGEHLFLTAVFTGAEHPDMKNTVTRTLKRIEECHHQLIEGWSGKMSEIVPVQNEITKLAGSKFLVRRDLEGVKLENERLRIADKVLETILSNSKDNPVAVILEDLHWADGPSLFILQYLARNIRSANVMVLGTARLKENAGFDRLLESMREETIVAECELKKLEMNDVRAMVDSVCPGNVFPQEFVDSMAERCGGNPLFVVEFLKHIGSLGAFAETDGVRKLVSDVYSVPDSIEELIQKRLLVLSPEALAMAEYASCIGREFQVDVAFSIGSLSNHDSALGQLQEAGIASRMNGKAEFCHAMYQDVIYSTISDRWKATHHRGIGEYLETAYADSPDKAAYELASHFSRTKEYAKAFNYCKRAGEKAESAYAAEQALAFYRDALAVLKKQRRSPEAQTEESAMLEKLGDMSAFANYFAEAISYYEQAAKLHGEGAAGARLLRKMAEARFRTGEYDSSLELLAKARQGVGEGRCIELGRICLNEANVRIMKGENDKSLSLLKDALAVFEAEPGCEKEQGNTLRLFANVHWRLGEYDVAQKHAQMSLDVMERIHDQQGIALALNALGLVNYDKGEYDLASEYYPKALAIMEHIGEKYLMSMVWNNMGLLFKDKGMTDQAIDYFKRSLEFRERVGDREGITATLVNMGNVYNTMGATKKALEMFQRSLAISRSIGVKKNIAGTLNAIAYIHTLHGKLDEAERIFSESVGICEEIGEKYILAHALDDLGDLAQERGNPEKALEIHLRSLAIREEIGDRNDQSWSHCEIAQDYFLLGDMGSALMHAEKASSIAHDINQCLEIGASYMVLGKIHRKTGDYSRSAEMFENAEKTLRESHYRHILAKAMYEHALLYKAMGNLTQAKETLAQVLADFEGMGMILWTERCRKALQELDK